MKALMLALICAGLAGPALAAEGEGKAAPPVTPIAKPPTPLSDMMLDVQRIQARMATGDKDAYAEQRTRMKAAGAAIAASSASAFADKAERDAVVVYLLSGGQPRDIAKIVERGDFPEADRDLLRGAAGYAEGKQADAELLLPYPAAEQSLRLASQLAYAQSVLMTPKDAHKALDLLDLARLLAPGTLIEEAALRREILLVGDLHDADRVTFLARQYVGRYGHSLYAADFVKGLSTVAVQYDLCSTTGDLDKFAALMQLATPEQARAFLLSVARASMLRGRFDVTAEAARDTLATAAAGSPDEARARLYLFATRFPAMSDAEADAAYAAIAQDKLSPADRTIAAAAVYVRPRLLDDPPAEAFADTWREASVAAARSPDLPPDQDPVAVTLRRGADALAAARAIENRSATP